MSTDNLDSRIFQLNDQKEKASRQSQVDAMNASLARLKGDHIAAKQYAESSRQNKKRAQDAQNSIDQIENSKNNFECDSELGKINFFLGSVGEALQRFQDGENIEDVQDIEYADLQLVYCVLESLNSNEDVHVFDVIRQARTVDVEDSEEVEDFFSESPEEESEEDDQDDDQDGDEYAEDNDEVDSEIENEIYDEIENELGYGYEDDEEDFD
jgi:hypothetical protein